MVFPPPRFVTLAAATTALTLVGVMVPTAASQAASVAMSIAVATDGHGPFTPRDEPGGDSGEHNGIVRTNDSVIYEVTVNSTGGTATAETFRLEAPENTAWSRLPSDCDAGNSTIEGKTLTCRLGDLTNATKKVSVVLAVGNSAVHGERLVPTGTVSADGTPPVEATATSAVTVSASPRYDLSIKTVTPSFVSALGPDGTTPGHRIVYPILIDFKGLTEGDTLLGYERLAGDVSFTDDVSRMFGRGESPAALLPVGSSPACGSNTGQVPGAPGGSGGGAANVVDSGAITCTQAGPGEPVSVTIRGIDSSLTSTPTTSVSGGAIAGGIRPYVVSGYVSLWIPEPASSETLTAINTFGELVAPSISGQPNFGSAGEPLENNSISRNIGAFLGMTGNLRYWGVDSDSGDRFELSGKYNKPYVTPSQLIRSSMSIGNTGTEPWNDALVCNTFDRSVQHLDAANGIYASSSSEKTTGSPQYAAFSASTPDDARDATCADADATWYDDPMDVPGGTTAVGMIRWQFTFPAASTLSFHSSLRVDDRIENYARVRTFASIKPGAERPWVHDLSTGTEANGTWADFLTATGDLARITSKVVDDGSTADDTPDTTQYVEQGKSVEFALFPTLTNATNGGKPDTVTITDTMPRGTTYVTGSSRPAPTSITEHQDEDGVFRQVLTWIIPDHLPNAPLPTITLTVRADQGVKAGPTSNHATISSGRDISDESFQVADRGLHILAVGAVSVVEVAKRSGVVLGDDLEWILRYSNNADGAFDSTDLITALPYVGDGRGTTVERASLTRGIKAQESERVFYTGADPSTIDIDPGHSSNQQGGGTRWCAETAFGSTGCPTTLGKATGVRIMHSDPILVGTTTEHTMSLSAPGAHDRDTAGSSFGLRVGNLSLPVSSNVATIEIHAGSIGHIVWFDRNEDGLQTDGEPGIGGAQVRLSGTDDRDHPVEETTTTDEKGLYAFVDLRPGTYTLAFGSADGGWTQVRAGDDPTLDSDVDAFGNAQTALASGGGVQPSDPITGVTSDLTVDAGALPKVDPVLPPEVTPPGPDEGSPTGAGTAHAPTLPAALAFTGSPVALWLIGAALLALLTGVTTVVLVRRRARGE